MTTPLGLLSERRAKRELREKESDFVTLARCFLLSKGRVSDAQYIASELDANLRVHEILEKAQPGMIGGASPQWGAELSDYQQIANGWIASLRALSVFDAALPAMVNVPFRTRLTLSTSAVIGTETDQGDVKPIFELAFNSEVLEARKAAATVVITDELARLGNAEALIGNELKSGVVAATDNVFLAALIAATTPIASSGDVLTDLAALLASIPSGAGAKFFFAVEASAAKGLAVSPGVAGPAFFGFTPNGGTIGGVTVVASDQLPSGTAVLFDATQIAATSENVALSASNEANATLAGISVSLFERNLLGIRAERWFGFAILRATAVQSLSGVDYSGVSP